MKHFTVILLLVCFFTAGLFAQVTNLIVNGSSTNFTMASGDMISWSYDIPVGETATIQVWIDTDQNGVLNEANDVLWQAFTQTDGGQGKNGPPDIDGIANGQISFGMPIGLAPAHYIMSFKNNNAGQTVLGIVNPLVSPTYTISGNISPAMANVALNLSTNDDNGTFWLGLTDASGNFEVQIGSDTTGNPWRLRIDNSYLFGSSIVSPQEYQIVIDPGVGTTYASNNFTVTSAAADISGTVKDENGNIIIGGSDVWVWANDGSLNRYTRTDYTGTYRLGLLTSELPVTNLSLVSGDSWDTTLVTSYHYFTSINSGEHITQDLTIYNVNSFISGRVTLNGNSPNFPINVQAYNPDSANVQTLATNDGYFRLNVTDKIYNYYLNLNNIQGYYYNIPVVHAGASNVIINLTLSDVEQIDPNIPANYLLSQNFPNPFNPSTAISYSLPKSGYTTLKIFNILGNEVATLVNEAKAVGQYNVEFNASNLPSGIYFYKIQAGSFVETKKMILLK